MKLISLNCNHCGGPIEVSADANFATCSFCQCQLAIERTKTAWSTRVLKEIQKTTELLTTDVVDLKRHLEIEKLDRCWEREKQKYVNQSGGLPNPSVAATTGLLYTIVNLVCLFLMDSRSASVWYVSLSIGIPFFVLLTVVEYLKKDAYLSARSEYRRQRRNIADSP